MIKTSNESIKFLVDSCINPDTDALKSQAVSVGKKRKEHTHNSKWFSTWDIRYNKIVDWGGEHGFESIKISRGNLWEAIGAYHRENKELFLVFKKPNLNKIIKYPFNGHYASIASVVNGDLPNIQTELFELNSTEEERIVEYEKMNEELIGKFDIKPERVILCGFSHFSFEAIIVNKWQQLAYTFDYSELIDHSYNEESKEQPEIDPPKDSKKKNISKTREPKPRIKGLKK